jgi:hypothetical protein
MSQAAPAARPHVQAQRKPAEPEFDPNAGLLDEVIAKTIDRLDLFAGKYAKELEDSNMTAFRRAAMTAIAIKRLRTLINEPVLALLRDLMNTPLGFKTDRGPHSKKYPTPYGDDIMRDCAIEALLRGVLWTGNEFNIIAGQCYITREGYTRKLQEIPGLTNLVVSPGIPRVDKDSGRTVVRFAASWVYNGVADSLKDHEGKPRRVFAITVNEGSGPDQIVGKAHRKGFKAIFDQIHGSSHRDRDDTDVEELLVGTADSAITDAQQATLNSAIAEHDASALLIRDHYSLQSGQRLLAAEFEGCLAKIRAGDFSGPRDDGYGLAEGELPNEDDRREFSADEIDAVLKEAGVDPWTVFKRFGVKRAADLTQQQRGEIITELAQTIS